MTEEASIPTWYSGLLLLLAAGVTAYIAWNKRAGPDRFKRHWAALAAVLLLLSIDEQAGLHEMTSESIRDELQTGGLLYYAWILPASVLVLAFAAAYIPFLLHLPSESRRILLTGGACLVLGALGVEAFEGWWAEANGDDNFVFALMTGLEESLEMLGIIGVIYWAIRYISPEMANLPISVGLPARGSGQAPRRGQPGQVSTTRQDQPA